MCTRIIQNKSTNLPLIRFNYVFFLKKVTEIFREKMVDRPSSLDLPLDVLS